MDSQHPDSDGAQQPESDVEASSSGDGVEGVGESSELADGASESFQDSVDEMLNSIELDSEGKDAESEEANPPQDEDDLLMQAGSILNGGDIDPAAIEDAKNEFVEEDETSLADMPDPLSMMVESDEAESTPQDGDRSEEATLEEHGEEEITAMPDPQELIREAVDESKPGSVVDRAGSLPPPPPAPVALEEDDIDFGAAAPILEDVSPVETQAGDDENATPVEAVDSTPPPTSESNDSEESESASEAPLEENEASLEPPEETGSEPPVAEEATEADTEDSDDDEDSLLLDDVDEAELGEELLISQDDPDDSGLAAPVFGSEASSNSAAPAESAKPGLWRKVCSSMPLAAGLAVLGVGLGLSSFKDELLEFVAFGDSEGTVINRHIASMSNRLFEEIGANSDHDMVWLESDIQRISELEIWINARVGASLKRDLYDWVDESIVYSRLPFTSESLETASAELELIGSKAPTPAWSSLIRKSASKGTVYPLNITYRLTRKSVKDDWELSNLRMKEGENGFAWAKGLPKERFGPRAVVFGTRDFSLSFRDFERKGVAYIKEAEAARAARIAAAEAESALDREKRHDLLMALSQGSYFRGMVIAGAEAKDTREISLIITETRNEGELIKGIFKLNEEDAPAKHFTGILDLVQEGEEIGAKLDLKTIAFAGQSAPESAPRFFNPGTVSRIQLYTDGYRMEGDGDELSLRLIRSL